MADRGLAHDLVYARDKGDIYWTAKQIAEFTGVPFSQVRYMTYCTPIEHYYKKQRAIKLVKQAIETNSINYVRIARNTDFDYTSIRGLYYRIINGCEKDDVEPSIEPRYQPILDIAVFLESKVAFLETENAIKALKIVRDDSFNQGEGKTAIDVAIAKVATRDIKETYESDFPPKESNLSFNIK